MGNRKSIRRSQLISPWGVGAMVNFPGDESLMTCGLDAWPFANENCPNDFKIIEERLAKRLGVSHFRTPPDFRTPGPGVEHANLKLPFVRFPRWHYCPYCGSMQLLPLYGTRQRCKGPNYSTGRSCHNKAANKRPWLVPVRFIAVCSKGHIEDFPFVDWVHREKPKTPDCQLRMRSDGGTVTLAGIKIECSCECSRTMAGAFNDNALSTIGYRCSGSRPWLGEIDDKVQGCGSELKAVQRGASNVYFSDVKSSIYLPRWETTMDRKIVEILDSKWDALTRRRIDGELNRDVFETIAEIHCVDCDKLYSAAKKMLDDKENQNINSEDDLSDSEEKYRKAEYDAIITGLGGDNQDFYVTNKSANEYEQVISMFFKSTSLLHKLRETRAFVGFSRLLPNNGSIFEKKNDLYKSDKINWLPAIVVRGEGIFFEFNSEKLDEWASRDKVKKRVSSLISNYKTSSIRRNLPDRIITAKFILLHTFAHIIINRLSYECGYGSSSIRERIYCDSEFPEERMNGILLYTASGDSEGSLGGLVRQGMPGRLEGTVMSALFSAKWCSADPVCMQSKGQGPDSCNLAACHNCALLPETCCEEGNKLLDRAMLIGTLEDTDISYFGDIDSLKK